MSNRLNCSLLVALLGTCTAAVVDAQVLPHPCQDCGVICVQPSHLCGCPPPCLQTRYQPVLETRYRQELHTTYRDVAQTRYRHEPRLESVPNTVYDPVTVDEGRFQQVWVPKLVTKQVPRTVVQQRFTYETVPYQVTHRVPQTATRLVPQQFVRYVSQLARLPQQCRKMVDSEIFSVCNST